MMRRRILVVAVLALLLPACAYFNSLYNARRDYHEAERALARGDKAGASEAYRRAIERAQRSVKKSPNGRWAGEALLILGRSHFAREEYASADSALARVPLVTKDAAALLTAQAYLGASLVREDEIARAASALDSAVARAKDPALVAFTRLWRARARFAQGHATEAWPDLDAAAIDGSFTGREARLERALRAVTLDSARGRAAFEAIFTDAGAAAQADSVEALARIAADRFGARHARTLLEPAARSAWLPAVREGMSFVRAQLALQMGDTTTALAEMRAAAARADPQTAATARVLIARQLLYKARDVGDLGEVRATLLPALSDRDAQLLVHSLKAVDVLLEKAQTTGQPLAFFAAGEIARDNLGAPVFARRLFTTYADVVPKAVWAPKALLAALALAPHDSVARTIRTRLEHYGESAYVKADGSGDAYTQAEERLDRTLIELTSAANTEADQRDAGVVRTVAVLDSVRALARADSMRVRCGSMLDSLSIAGVRADSVRVACMRRDSTQVALFLKMDTLALKGISKAKADSSARAATNAARRLKASARDTTIR
jgi:tetratricopeptide (TPR) repeat protein